MRAETEHTIYPEMRWERYTAATLKLALKKLTEELSQETINSLAWCQKRGHLAKVQYYLFNELQFDYPAEAVVYLYESMKVGFTPAQKRFHAGYSHRTCSPEEENLEGKTAKELFIKGLLCYVDVGCRGASLHVALQCFTKLVYLEPFNLEAHHLLGKLYSDDSRRIVLDIPLAVMRDRFAAAQGNSLAQVNLGAYYQKGSGVPQDEKEAIKWFYRAAMKGDARGQRYLAWYYLMGKMGRRNKRLGIKWLELAAEQGDTYAQIDLARCYKNGWAVSNNLEEALKWFKRAAREGAGNIAWKLFGKYSYGKGVQKDRGEAAKWCRASSSWNELAHLHIRSFSDNDFEEDPFIVKYHDDMCECPCEYGVTKLVRENREEFLKHLREDDLLLQEDVFRTINIISAVSSQKELSSLLIEYIPQLYHFQTVEILQAHLNLREICPDSTECAEDYTADLGIAIFDKIIESVSLVSENVFDEKELAALDSLKYFVLAIFFMTVKESNNSYRRDCATVWIKKILIQLHYLGVETDVNRFEDIGTCISQDRMAVLISAIIEKTGVNVIKPVLEGMLLRKSNVGDANTIPAETYPGTFFSSIKTLVDAESVAKKQKQSLPSPNFI